MQLNTYTYTSSIDLSNLRCPHIIIAIIKALASLQPDNVLQVIAADLNAPSNITAWVSQSDHELLDLYMENGRFVCYVRCGAPTHPNTQKDTL